MPASSASSARRIAVSGDFSDGLSTSELPAASAGPIFQAAMISGKFHGTIAPTTPIGSRVISASASWPGGRDLVVDLVDRLGVPAHAARRGRDVDAEAVADRLAHVERLEQRQLRVACSHQLGEAQQHALALGRRLIGPVAALESGAAAATAASTSAVSQAATAASVRPSIGLMQSKVAPECAGWNAPLISARPFGRSARERSCQLAASPGRRESFIGAPIWRAPCGLSIAGPQRHPRPGGAGKTTDIGVSTRWICHTL